MGGLCHEVGVSSPIPAHAEIKSADSIWLLHWQEYKRDSCLSGALIMMKNRDNVSTNFAVPWQGIFFYMWSKISIPCLSKNNKSWQSIH